MAAEVKYFHNALPNRLAMKRLFHSHTLNVSGLCPVQASYCLP